MVVSMPSSQPNKAECSISIVYKKDGEQITSEKYMINASIAKERDANEAGFELKNINLDKNSSETIFSFGFSQGPQTIVITDENEYRELRTFLNTVSMIDGEPEISQSDINVDRFNQKYPNNDNYFFIDSPYEPSVGKKFNETNEFMLTFGNCW